jgi:hypothetical protein
MSLTACVLRVRDEGTVVEERTALLTREQINELIHCRGEACAENVPYQDEGLNPTRCYEIEVRSFA